MTTLSLLPPSASPTASTSLYPSGQSGAVASVLGNYYDNRFHPLGFIQQYKHCYFALSTAGADDLNPCGYTLLGGADEIDTAIQSIRSRWQHRLRKINRP